MAVNEFADISKELYTQVKIVEDMVKSDLYKEAGKMLLTAEQNCRSLESLMEEDNKIQAHIVDNRRREIKWIQDAIQLGLAKARSKKPVKKRAARSKK
jgi:hypothetical protein